MRGTDDLQRYIERVRPLCVELFRRAHIIVGSADIAEFVLQNAIADAYARRKEWQGRVGLRETLVTGVQEEALDELNRAIDSGSYERDADAVLARSMVDSLPMDLEDVTQQMLLGRILREKPVLRRMVMLKYGCGLDTKEIAFIVQVKHAAVRDELRLFSIRLSRAQKKMRQQPGALDRQIAKLCEDALRRPGEDVPDIGTVFEHFADMAEDEKKTGARVGRVLRAILMTVGALLCALLFWLIAVLLEPRLSERQEPIDMQQEMSDELAAENQNDINIFFI